MSDSEVTIGANLTPFKRAMEEVKATAAEAGNKVKETLGFESGNNQAFRSENRAVKGVERFTAALTNAKDPITGFAQGLEGLASGFRLTGAVFAGFAIGDFLREQFTKAAESAQDFYEKTDKVFSVGKESSRSFKEDAIKEFDKATEEYGKMGFLDKLIFGQGYEATIARGKETVEAIRQEVAEANAKLIRDETALINGNPEQKRDAQIEVLRDKYKTLGDNAKSPEEKKALEEKLQAEIAAVDQKYLDQEDARLQKVSDKQEREREKEKAGYVALAEEKEKQAKLADEAGGGSKISKLQKELDEATRKVKTTWGTAVEQAKLVTAQMEAQNRLSDAQTEEANKRKELQDDIAKKTKEQTTDQNAVRSALEETTIFHGEVSSLRKIGLGGGVSQNNSEQVKKLTEANKRLDDINTQLKDLNTKLEST